MSQTQAGMIQNKTFQYKRRDWRKSQISIKKLTKIQIKRAIGISVYKAMQYSKNASALESYKKTLIEHEFWKAHFEEQYQQTTKLFTFKNLTEEPWLRIWPVNEYIQIQRGFTIKKMRERYGEIPCLKSDFQCSIYHHIDAKCGNRILERKSCRQVIVISRIIVDQVTKRVAQQNNMYQNPGF